MVTEGGKPNRPKLRKRPRQRSAFFAVALPFVVWCSNFHADGAIHGASLCQSDNYTIGYSDLDTLRNDLLLTESDQGNGTYILCPFTRYHITVPLSITSQSLQCGSTGASSLGCILDGGSRQLSIQNHHMDILVQGVTFRRATDVSVEIVPSIGTGSVTFRDCRWEDSNGFTALWTKKHLGSATPSVSRTPLQIRRNISLVQVFVEDCTFEGDILTPSLILQEADGYSLTIQDSTIQGNMTEGKIIPHNTVELFLADSGITKEKFGDDSSHIKSTQIERDTLEVGTKNCTSTSCSIETLDECYSSWTNLSRAVRTSSSGGEYVICPGSLLSLYSANGGDAPMVIQKSNTIIKCGKSGARVNNCLVIGGQDQVLLKGNATNIRFEGITFVQSSRVSIAAMGTARASASFVDCEWSGNVGNAAVLIYYADTIPVMNETFATLSKPRQRSMMLDFTECTFAANRLMLGSIVNFHGSIDLVRTIFLGNEGEAGAVSIQSNGTLAMQGSCFIGNSGNLGVVFVNGGSKVIQNENSFGEGNTNTFLGCSDGINVVSEGILCTDVDSCVGDCQIFNATSCEKLTFPFTSVSAEPTSQMSEQSAMPFSLPPLGSSPSLIDTQRPSLSDNPSMAGSHQPDVSPLRHTTKIPSMSPSIFPTVIGAPDLKANLSSGVQTNPNTKTKPCSLDKQLLGYDDSEAFLFDLALGISSARYILCPGISIDGKGLFASSMETLNIQCADPTIGCFWSANNSQHLVIEGSSGSPINVSISGVTFRQASQSSVVVQLSLGSTSNIRFSECVWENNSGEATIMIIDQDAQSEMIGGRSLQSSATTKFERCIFDGNQASASIVVANIGDITIDECTFRNNTAKKSIVASTIGTTEASATRFNGNTYLGAKGLLFVGKDALFSSSSSENCQQDNVALGDANGNICKGTYLVPTVSCKVNDTRPVCQGSCLKMLSCQDDDGAVPSIGGVAAAPSLMPSILSSIIPSAPSSPTDTQLTDAPSVTSTQSFQPSTEYPSYIPLECYSTWKSLGNAVADAGKVLGGEITIKICANTLLDAFNETTSAPVIINDGNINIICGDEGKLEDNCLLFGGKNHFKISGQIKRLRFAGLTFIGARKLSVLGAADTSSSAIFESCRWTQNNGIGSILVYNEERGEPYLNQRNIEMLQAPSEPSMSATFIDCIFNNNTPSFAVIASIAGTISVTGTLFANNSRSRIGPISATNSTNLSLASSCFLHNEVLIAGVAFLDTSSRLALNKENFADGNIVRLMGTCTEAFQETSGSCIKVGTCNGDCQSFSASSCDHLYLLGSGNIKTPPPRLVGTSKPGVSNLSSPPAVGLPTTMPPSDPGSGSPTSSTTSASPLTAPLPVQDSPVPSYTPAEGPITPLPATYTPSQSLLSFPDSSTPTNVLPSPSPSAPPSTYIVSTLNALSSSGESILTTPSDAEFPAEVDVPRPVFGHITEIKLFSSGMFIRTVTVAVIFLLCCVGTYRYMRVQVVKAIYEDGANEKIFKKERELDWASQKKHDKTLEEVRVMQEDQDLDLEYGGDDAMGEDALRKGENGLTEVPTNLGGWLKFDDGRRKAGEQQGNEEKEGLLRDKNVKMNRINDKKYGLKVKVIMMATKVESHAFT